MEQLNSMFRNMRSMTFCMRNKIYKNGKYYPSFKKQNPIEESRDVL